MKLHEKLLSEATGFMKSRVILTAAELDLFTRIHSKPATAQELASDTAWDPRALARLLDCLVPLNLMEKRNGRYHVTEQGKRNSSLHPKSLLPILMHMADGWQVWSDLTDIVKNGSHPKKSPTEGQLGPRQESFQGAMHAIAQGLSREIAECYDARPYKRLLDVGGGTGPYTIAFLQKNQHMEGVLFDLKSVIPLAAKKIREQGFNKRVSLVAGDFYRDALPKGCDLALLSAIIHQNSPEQNITLYGKIYTALNENSAVLIRDHIMDASRTSPADGTLFALNMLVNTPGGDTYTFAEVKEGLEKVGFTEVKWIRRGERMDSLVEAKK